jgi:hypothetical protein
MKLKNAIGLLCLGLLAQILVSCYDSYWTHQGRQAALNTPIIPTDGAIEESPYSSRNLGIIDSVQMERVAVMDFYSIRIFSNGWYPYALKLKIKNISTDTLSFDYTLKDIHTDTVNGFPIRKDYLSSVTRLAPNTLIEQKMDTVYGNKGLDSLSFSMRNLAREK